MFINYLFGLLTFIYLLTFILYLPVFDNFEEDFQRETTIQYLNTSPRVAIGLVRLGYLIWSMAGDSRHSGSSIVRSLSLVTFCFELSPFAPTFLSSRCLSTLLHYSCVCLFLLLYPCCSHAWGILCGIRISCMGSLFPIVHFGLLRSCFVAWKRTALTLCLAYLRCFLMVITYLLVVLSGTVRRQRVKITNDISSY